MDVGWIFVALVLTFGISTFALRWPLPLGLILASVVAALLAGFGIPFRHLVEGSFGYLNLILALFAGAFFGQVMRRTGAADALATAIAGTGNRWLALTAAGALLFATGMLTGIAGVAVLAIGVFAAPLLDRLGLPKHAAAAFIALMATLGMIAPPLNVPAMVMTDGVNMPFDGFAVSLLVLSVPTALFVLAWFGASAQRPIVLKPASMGAAANPAHGRRLALIGLAVLVGILGFWTLLRAFPGIVMDPSIPIVLVIGGLVGLPLLTRRDWSEVVQNTFSGVPLLLAAVLVTVGVLVQTMAATGVRGWLVIHAMSFEEPWLYGALASMPLLGGVLTSIGTSNVLGVPFAFAFIAQDMIVNIAALSAIAALAEFCPPTAISAALAGYVVGERRLWPIIRTALPALGVLTVLAIVMLIFAPELAPYLR